MATGKELKPGMVLRIDGSPWLIAKADMTKTGRNSAVMKTKLKNLQTGSRTEAVYGPDDKLDNVSLERKEATLSSITGDVYTFMDTHEYGMHELNAEDIEGLLPYIDKDMQEICELIFLEGKGVAVELPRTVSRQVIETNDALGTDATDKIVKPAKLANGTEVQIAGFIQTGEWIDIDTHDGSYKGRSAR